MTSLEYEAETTDKTLSVIGGLAEVIKNNVKESPKHFSWLIKVPRKIPVEELENSMMIFNNQLQRVQTTIEAKPKGNMVSVTPLHAYTPMEEYYFWAKFGQRIVCIAFYISEDNVMQTFDLPTSREKLNEVIRSVKGIDVPVYEPPKKKRRKKKKPEPVLTDEELSENPEDGEVYESEEYLEEGEGEYEPPPFSDYQPPQDSAAYSEQVAQQAASIASQQAMILAEQMPLQQAIEKAVQQAVLQAVEQSKSGGY